MDELIESKNALWRRENQLRTWDGSETNAASSTPRDRQLSAVKFHDDCVFLAACSSADTSEVMWLLGRGADINTANVDGLTALHQVRRCPLILFSVRRTDRSNANFATVSSGKTDNAQRRRAAEILSHHS